MADYRITDTDYEQLSAYLDDALLPNERAALEARLAAEPLLQRELTALRRTVALIHTLPATRAPRNFTLTPAMLRPTRWLIFPTTQRFSALSAAAAVLLLFFAGYLFNGRSLTNALPTTYQAVQSEPETQKTGAVELMLEETTSDALPFAGSETGASAPDAAPAMVLAMPQSTPTASALVVNPNDPTSANIVAVPMMNAAPADSASGAGLAQAAPPLSDSNANTPEAQRALASPTAPTGTLAMETTAAPSATASLAALPTASPTATLLAAATTPEAEVDVLPLLVIGLAGLCLVLAVGTTWVRRRSN